MSERREGRRTQRAPRPFGNGRVRARAAWRATACSNSSAIPLRSRHPTAQHGGNGPVRGSLPRAGSANATRSTARRPTRSADDERNASRDDACRSISGWEEGGDPSDEADEEAQVSQPIDPGWHTPESSSCTCSPWWRLRAIASRESATSAGSTR